MEDFSEIFLQEEYIEFEGVVNKESDPLMDLLNKFDLADVMPFLKDASVTYRSLQYLKNEDLKEIISPVGLRVEFREKLFGWRKKDFGIDDETFSAPSKVQDWLHDSHLQLSSSNSCFTLDKNLKILLMQTAKGKAILEFYKNVNSLNDVNRNELINIIVEESLFGKSTQRDFLKLVEEICQLFPTEKKMSKCNSIKVESECSLEPRGVLILPPVISGRLSTKNNFNFKYGRIEVRAKLPIGDWLFPLISLQPSASAYGEHYKSGEMRIAYAHCNHNLMWQNKNINGARLFGGVILNKDAEIRHQYMKDTTLPNVNHFGDEFHIYTLTWKPDQLIMTVDGNEYGRIKTNFKQRINEPIWNKGEHNAPLDQMFYITLGLAAGGNGDFPNTDGKPWGNTDPRGSWSFYKNRNTWFPTWSQPSLEVDYVRVYAV